MKQQQAKAEAAAKPDRPLSVLTIELPEDTEHYDADRVREELKELWAEVWDGTPPIPIFVIPPGCAVGVIQVSGGEE